MFITLGMDRREGTRHISGIRQSNGKQRGRSSPHPIGDRGKNNPNPKMQLDKGTYISNWSNFKPEFSGKPEEDVEAHLLCSNDWMDAHHFNKDIKVQRFCSYTVGGSKTVVPFSRALRRNNMGTITKFI